MSQSKPNRIWVRDRAHQPLINLPAIRIMSMIGLRTHQPQGRRPDRVLVFPNLVTNAALDGIGRGISIFNMTGYVAVGTGSTVPAFTDTGLANELNRTGRAGAGDGANRNSGAAPWYSEYDRVKYFVEGEATGNLTEVGFFYRSTLGAADDVMYNKQLIRDANGVPTAFPVFADEQLYVTLKVRNYAPAWSSSADDVTGSFVVAEDGIDQTYNFTLRPERVNDSSYWQPQNLGYRSTTAGNFPRLSMFAGAVLGTNTGALSGTAGATPSSKSFSAYVTGSYTYDLTCAFEPANGNPPGGWNGWQLSVDSIAGLYQMVTDRAVPKNLDRRFSFTFRASWGRYTP